MHKQSRSPWFWVPSIYFAEGIPYVIVMMVSVVMYKRLGVSNTDIALYTSWLYLPWVIKPLWSPVVDVLRTKRFWIVTMQLIIGAGLGAVALTIPLPGFFKLTLGFLWLLAFSSATHDIAADGFYMLGLSQHDQAWFVGIRSTFYRFAMITGQGLLIMLAGFLETHTGLPAQEIEISARPDVMITQPVHPDSLPALSGGQEQQLQVWPQRLDISTHNVHFTYADSLMTFVYDWNIAHGFAAEEIQAGHDIEEESWWARVVSEPLENFLRQTFGREQDNAGSEMVGNVGVIYFRLRQPPEPGQEIVINFGRSSGDKSIFMMDKPALGTRLVFTESNWRFPALAAIQLDPKLKQSTSATFSSQAGNIPLAWSITFAVLAVLFVLFFIYHKFILPYPKSDHPAISKENESFIGEFIETFVIFFRREKIGRILAFLLLYRLAESQLVKLASPFLLDSQEAGGMALTTGQVGFIYGTIGILFLTLGGLLGGFLAARHGLKFWLWPMAIAINLPDVVYVYLSYAQPDNLWLINACVAVEQFGYGFGFTAYMLYMIYVSEGDHKTAHFAITTAFMALGMMIPGMVSGWLQELIGYQHFFIWVMIATLPGFLILFFIPLDKEFGRKKTEE